MMKRYFRCGIIKRRRDGLYSYDVTAPAVLESIIISFFRKYPFFSESKKKNFLLFEKAVRLMAAKRHLTRPGLLELVDLRELINQGKGRKRKYTKENILLAPSETKR